MPVPVALAPAFLLALALAAPNASPAVAPAATASAVRPTATASQPPRRPGTRARPRPAPKPAPRRGAARSTAARPPAVPIADALRDASSRYEAAWAAGDARAVAALYTPGARWVTADARPLVGRGTIEGALVRGFGDAGRWRETTLERTQTAVDSVAPGAAVTSGEYVLRRGAERVDAGRYQLVWSRTDEGWRIRSEQDASSQRSTVVTGPSDAEVRALRDRARTDAVAEERRVAAARDAALRRMVDSVNTAYLDALRRRDVDAATALYAPDAVLHAPGQRPIVGRDAIRARLAGWLPRLSVEDVRITTERVHGDAAEAAATGRYAYVVRAGRRDTRDAGRWVMIWRRQPDGTWRIVHDATESVPEGVASGGAPGAPDGR